MTTADRGPKTITYSRVVHLSHVIEPGIPHWPGDPNAEFETVAEATRDGYHLRRFSVGWRLSRDRCAVAVA